MKIKEKLVTKADVLEELEFLKKEVDFFHKLEHVVVLERGHSSKKAHTTSTDLHQGRYETYGKVKALVDSILDRSK